MTDQLPIEDPQDPHIQFLEPVPIDIPTSPELRKEMLRLKAENFCEEFGPKARTLLGEIEKSHGAAAKEALAAVIAADVKDFNDPLVFARGAAEMAYAELRKHEERKQSIRQSKELSDDGKSEAIRKANQEIGEAFDGIERKYIDAPLERLHGRHAGFVPLKTEPSTEAESAKVVAKLAAYRSWNPPRILEDVRWLLERNDTVTLHAVRPLLEREIDSPRPWWEPYGGPLETLVEAVNKKLDTNPSLMRHRCAIGAAELVRSDWKYIRRFALGGVRGPGKGSAAFEVAWGAGALSAFNAPEKFRPNTPDVAPTNSSTDAWMS